VKRPLALVLVVVVAAGAVALVARFDRERQYRALLAQGEQASRDGNAWGAIEAFSGALVLRPDSMVSFYRRGLAYRDQGHDEQAIRDWKDAHRLAPDAPEPLVALAELYDRREQPSLAAARYAEAAELLKDEDPALLYALGLARYRSGAPAAAIDPLHRAVARHDGLAPAHHLLGLAYRDVGNLDAAIASLDRAIRLDRKLIAAREELADLYRAVGRHGDELQQLQALVQLDGQIDRRIAVALAQARQRQFDAALAGLGAIAAEAPSDSRLYLALGRVHLARAEALGDAAAIGQAREALEIALGGTARRSEGLALLGRALYLAGDHDGALRILQQAVATSPADRHAFVYLADAAERLQRHLLARDALLMASALQGSTATPETRDARARRIGLLSLDGGDPTVAARFLRRAVDAGLADVSTLAAFARSQWETGERDGARATLARAVALDRVHPDVVAASRVVR